MITGNLVRDRIAGRAEEWAEELLPRHWSRFGKMFWMGMLAGTVLGLAVLASYLLYSGVLRAARPTGGPLVYTQKTGVQLLCRLRRVLFRTRTSMQFIAL